MYTLRSCCWYRLQVFELNLRTYLLTYCVRIAFLCMCLYIFIVFPSLILPALVVHLIYLLTYLLTYCELSLCLAAVERLPFKLEYKRIRRS